MQSGYQPHSSRIKSDHDEHARFDRVARIKREANTQLPQLPVQSSADPESCWTKARQVWGWIAICSLDLRFAVLLFDTTLHERGANPSKSNSTDIVVLTFHGDLMIL